MAGPPNVAVSYAGGNVLAWEACTTQFALGFSTLRLETNSLFCSAEEGLAHAGTQAQRACTQNAVHLLCRALRLAPQSYRRFLLAADGPNSQLTVTGGVLATESDEPVPDYDYDAAAEFGSIAALAAAMGQFAAAEGLEVQLLLDESCIVVRRAGDVLPGGTAEAL